MPTFSTNLIQAAATTAALPTSQYAATSYRPPMLQAAALYFHLEMLTADGDNLSPVDTPADQLLAIEHGSTYRMLIYLSDESDESGQKAIHLRSPLQCSLTCDGPIDILNQSFSVPIDDADSFEYCVNVRVPEHCPTRNVTFTLVYKSASSHRQAVAAKMVLHINGTYTPVDKNLLQSAKVTLDEVPPEQITLLYIVACSPDTITIRGWNRLGGNFVHHFRTWDPIRLGDFVNPKQPVNPREARMRVRNFSRSHLDTFIKWLNLLFSRFSHDLCLVIADHTSLETPWEMLELSDGKYLGARAKVVRWMPIQMYDDWYLLQMQDVQKHGSVIAYLDDQELGVMQTYGERVVLQSLKHEHCAEARSLVNLLWNQRSPQDVGLIYLGCHGFDGMAIGSPSTLNQRINIFDLEIVKPFPDPRPVVFVNACESARLQWDRQRDFKGLLEVFLARYASGYIGTSGGVGSSYASQVAQRLLNEARRPDGALVAEVLRLLKEEAAQLVSDEVLRTLSPGEQLQRERDFLYAFMYVYYGNALVRLCLLPASASSTIQQGGVA